MACRLTCGPPFRGPCHRTDARRRPRTTHLALFGCLSMRHALVNVRRRLALGHRLASQLPIQVDEDSARENYAFLGYNHDQASRETGDGIRMTGDGGKSTGDCRPKACDGLWTKGDGRRARLLAQKSRCAQLFVWSTIQKVQKCTNYGFFKNPLSAGKRCTF